MKNQLSKTAVISNLKRFYGNNVSDDITLDDIFINSNRADKDKDSNRSWLYNKMSAMRQYDFFKKEYIVRNHTRSLCKLVLTPEGRVALGRNATVVQPLQIPFKANESDRVNNPPVQAVTLQSISDIVDEFNRQNPSWEIEIVPKRIKKEVGLVEQ